MKSIRDMNLSFFDNEGLEKELEKLFPFHRIAFAASCCERLFPFYKTFSETDDWGDSSIPRKALDKIWQILGGELVNQAEVESLIEDCCCKGICPTDDDNFGSSSLFIEAGNAIYAICATLDACLEPKVQYIVEVNQHLKEAIEYYIDSFDESFKANCQEYSMAEGMEVLNCHSMVTREMAKQSEDLQRLKEAETLDYDFLEWLRISAKNDGKMMVKMFYS